MKIAFVMFNDGSNIKFEKYPGYYIYHNFIAHGEEVIPIGGEPENNYLFHIGKTLFYRLFGRRYIRQRNKSYLKNAAKKIDKELSTIDYDIIFAFGNLALSYIKPTKPIYFWTDTSFVGLISYKHPYYLNLTAQTFYDSKEAEKEVFDKCNMCFYTSDWAVEHTLKSYNISKEKVKKVALGANIDEYPDNEEINRLITNRLKNKNNVLSFLLVGNNWKNKGGDIAVEIIKKLNNLGIKSILTVLGCEPKLATEDEKYVNIVGFLNKKNPDEKEKFNNYFRDAYMYLMPTRADAYGHVFAEASAFALPVIGTNVAGVPEVVRNEINGYAFELDASTDEIVDYIYEIYHNDDKYETMARNAYDIFIKELNWEVSTRKVLDYIYQDLAKK